MPRTHVDLSGKQPGPRLVLLHLPRQSLQPRCQRVGGAAVEAGIAAARNDFEGEEGFVGVQEQLDGALDIAGSLERVRRLALEVAEGRLTVLSHIVVTQELTEQVVITVAT